MTAHPWTHEQAVAQLLSARERSEADRLRTEARMAAERRVLADLDCTCGHGVLDHTEGVCAAVLDEEERHPVKACGCDQWRLG